MAAAEVTLVKTIRITLEPENYPKNEDGSEKTPEQMLEFELELLNNEPENVFFDDADVFPVIDQQVTGTLV